MATNAGTVMAEENRGLELPIAFHRIRARAGGAGRDLDVAKQR
jgi:hypothetical protein